MSVRIVSATPAFRRSPDHRHTPALAPACDNQQIDLEVQRCRRLAEERQNSRCHAGRDYAREVGPQPDAIVVGHSLGGLTIPHIEARARVYLAALPPLERVYDECFVEGFGGTVRDTRDRSYWPDAATAAARMYPDCSRTQSDWAFAQLRRQARLDPMPAPFGRGDVVIATLQDAAVDLTGKFARPAPTARV